MGFDYELFTMENISDLSVCLLDGDTDLLLLASNCLNDAVVKEHFLVKSSATPSPHTLHGKRLA